jgi:TRAP-type C4-dicarboxylate transport system permease small subunit
MSQDRRDWIERCARTGFAVKGVLYLLLGGLTLQVGLGNGGRLNDLHGALATLLTAPGGRFLLGLIAAGLGLYSAWRFIEAITGAGGRKIGSRAQSAFSGAIYGGLSTDAVRLAVAGAPVGDSPPLPQMFTTSELARWLAILVALLLLGYGGWQMVRAFSRQVSDALSLSHVRRHAGPWAVHISRLGIGGRAVVLIVLGLVLLRRAIVSVEAAANTTTADSLRLIGALPTGRWLLVMVAVGLMAFGFFQLVQARYRRISPP